MGLGLGLGLARGALLLYPLEHLRRLGQQREVGRLVRVRFVIGLGLGLGLGAGFGSIAPITSASAAVAGF